MRPSSLGGAACILRRTLSVRLSVCLSVRLSVRPVIVATGNVFSTTASVTSRHLTNCNDTHVLFGTHRGPHIVRPSRPHKLVMICHWCLASSYVRILFPFPKYRHTFFFKLMKFSHIATTVQVQLCVVCVGVYCYTVLLGYVL